MGQTCRHSERCPHANLMVGVYLAAAIHYYFLKNYKASFFFFKQTVLAIHYITLHYIYKGLQKLALYTHRSPYTSCTKWKLAFIDRAVIIKYSCKNALCCIDYCDMSLNVSAPQLRGHFRLVTTTGANKNVQMPNRRTGKTQWSIRTHMHSQGRQRSFMLSGPTQKTLNTFLVLLYGVTFVPKIWMMCNWIFKASQNVTKKLHTFFITKKQTN